LEPAFIEWLFAATPGPETRFARRWRELPRLSAQQIPDQVNLRRLYEQRARLRQACLLPMLKNFRWSVFFRLDLEATARAFAAGRDAVPELRFAGQDDPMQLVHDQMFRSAVLRHRREPGWERFEAGAFARLREMIVREARLSPASPHRNVMEDQIVWARSPIRFDLAGGWTDTPPYCIEHGGKVLNLAADLNGQPPIQVFAKLSERPELVMRSIDLGVEEHVRTYAELDTFERPESPFALAKAAFALAGFLPRFHSAGGFASLEEQLLDFGAGIEVSLLAAVPKGSGLGTSSILAATVLAALGDLCGLDWDRNTLFTRTLALEQMLTTGGGWQDQAGAIYRGIKLIETGPGLVQKPVIGWLPQQLFNHDYANRSILLYYTGITRLAKNILGEIVRGIFLNSPSHLGIIADIGANADYARSAIQKCDYAALQAAIRSSWALNQRLDAGTNPPDVQHILDRVQDYLGATKLLGAGGGGYLLLFGKDETAAAKIKQLLTSSPPNARARFVDFSLSETGLQLTRS
jgi:galactokinase/mevalonate kinase-like predicted kinase